MDTPKLKSKSKILPENTDVITFKGLNRMPHIEKGELRSMVNVCSDYPTCISPRPPRYLYNWLYNPNKDACNMIALSNGKFCWTIGSTFFYDGIGFPSTVINGTKSMCEFGNYVLIFPDKKYFDINSETINSLGSGTYPAAGSCPDIKWACVFNNRVWGVGGNGVYGSKFKDPFTWTKFSNPVEESDSIYFEIDKTYGELTGIKPLENHMVFTTSTTVFELYGNKPTNYIPRLVTNSSGCISHKSMAEIDGRVFMLDRKGISVYGGSFPQPISLQLQEKVENYPGVGIAFNHKYYVSFSSSANNQPTYPLYVYDTLLGYWYQEDSNLRIFDFCVSNNALYALTTNSIMKLSGNSDYDETVAWQVETDRFTEQYLGMKATSKIKIEVELESGSDMSVFIKTDGSNYRLLGTDTQSGYHYFTTYEIPRHAFWFQLKLAGNGKCKVYSIIREIIVKSDIE